MNKSVIIGTLLGDTWIQKHNNRPNSYSISFQQSNKEYCKWKADLSNLKYSFYERNRFDKRTNKIYRIFQSLLQMNKEDKEYFYNLFYTPTKQINLEILNMVDNLALTVWYLDDGNVYYNGNICHITLAVNGFTLEQRELIINWFRQKYNLEFKHSGKAIRITSRKECEKFMNLVEQYIPECMDYKILNNAIRKHREAKR